MELKNENLKIALNDIVNKYRFKNYDIVVSPGAKKGDNNLGEVFKIAISGETESGEKEDLKLFCKTPLNSITVRNNFMLNDLFKREAFILDVLITEYKEFEKENLIVDGFESFPKIVAADTSEFKEFILMTDLSSNDFLMFDYKDGIDFEHMQLVLSELGKFHALGLAIKNIKPDLFHSYKNTVNIYNQEKAIELKNMYERFLESADNYLKFEGKYDAKWIHFRENYFKHFGECINGCLAEPYAVISHGDLWNNNILFKYENGVPKEVCFVDWQLSRHTSPVFDLAGYVFLHTTKNFREKHYQTLLHTYHNSVTTFLRRLGADPEKVFPFSALINQLKLFGKYAMVRGIYLPIQQQSEENSRCLRELLEDHSSLIDFCNISSSTYKQMHDIFIDLVDLEYL